jgi:deazaflavin-dependent oxidoreductase (nitroreductase family)
MSAETQTPTWIRNLTKYIASGLTIRFHPRVIRAGGKLHLALFRLFRGAGFLGADTLILTTQGRVTGAPRSTPLYFVEENGRRYVAASFAGSETPPFWYLNLVADPQVDVQVHGQRRAHTARVLPEYEATTVWPKLTAVYPPFARYQNHTSRHIPVIELTPSPETRAAA